jgi:hypothetical protein
VGVEEGEARGIGIRGLSLYYPPLNLHLPTVQLPQCVPFRTRPRMLVQPSEAPYVEEVLREEYAEEAAPRDIPREQPPVCPPPCAPCPVPGHCAQNYGPASWQVNPAMAPAPRRIALVGHSAAGSYGAPEHAPVFHHDGLAMNPSRGLEMGAQAPERQEAQANGQSMLRLEQMLDNLESQMTQMQEAAAALKFAREKAREAPATATERLQPVAQPEEIRLLSANSPIVAKEEPRAQPKTETPSGNVVHLICAIGGALVGLTAGFGVVCLRVLHVLTRLHRSDREAPYRAASQFEIVATTLPRN